MLLLQCPAPAVRLRVVVCVLFGTCLGTTFWKSGKIRYPLRDSFDTLFFRSELLREDPRDGAGGLPEGSRQPGGASRRGGFRRSMDVATLSSGHNRKLKSRFWVCTIFGRFPANLGPRTSPDGSGWKNGA